MNKFAMNATATGEDLEPGGFRDASSSVQLLSPAVGYGERIAELEFENSRLHRLVAELLLKNEQLRKPD